MDIASIIAENALGQFNKEKAKGPVSAKRREEILREAIESRGFTVSDDFERMKAEVVRIMISLHQRKERKAS